MPKVAVVTPVFNGREHTQAFLKTLANQDYANLMVVIVDDGSIDGTSEMIRRDYPNVVLLQGNGSLWWSGATNVGVRHCLDSAAYILTINNDVELKPDYVSTLLAVAQVHPDSLVGSKVCYRDDPEKVWFFGACFNAKNGDMQHINGLDSDFHEVADSEWLTGMGVLVPIKVFRDIGFYNEIEFPQYFGDAEFSVRAKQAGYKLVVSPNSRVYADVSSQWVLRQMKNPKLSFIPNLFFSIRSPYQFKTRRTFYARYWKHPHGSLLKLYCVTLIGLYASYAMAVLKRIIGVESLRTFKRRSK